MYQLNLEDIKVKKILCLFFVSFLLNYTIIAESDNTEIFMHTRDTGGETVEFLVFVNTNKPIWNPSSNLIDTENWQNPASLEIEGDDTSTEYGWHTDKAQRIYDTNPCL